MRKTFGICCGREAIPRRPANTAGYPPGKGEDELIKIRLSAASMDALGGAMKRRLGVFTVYRLKGSDEPKNGHYKAYLTAELVRDKPISSRILVNRNAGKHAQNQEK